MVLYVRTYWLISLVYFLFLGCSFTEQSCTFGSVGLLLSISHWRSRSLSLAKAAELPWYCLFGCVALLFSFYRYRFRSLFPPKSPNFRGIVFSGVLVCLLFPSYRYRFRSLFINDSSRNVVVLYLRKMGFGCSLGFGYSLFHCRFRLPFRSKDAELSWYRPFGIVCDRVIVSTFC